ncbi:MAG: PAS domain S-box protein, partial [Planctomycetales bacterium]|nr:PAS domain S-box protein [Planctomycetales bacterium]
MFSSGMTSPRVQSWTWIPLAIVCMADLLTPTSVNVGLLYVCVVFVSLWSAKRTFVLTVAGICSLLVATKLLMAMVGSSPVGAAGMLNAVLIWSAIWGVALHGLFRKANRLRVQEALSENNEMLEHLVNERTAALEAKQQILSSIIECLSSGVVVADQTGRFVLFNSAAQRLVGRQFTNLPKEKWQEHWGICLPDRVTKFPEDQLPLLRAMRGEEVDGIEMFLQNPEVPQGRMISVSARPWRDVAGNIQGGIVVTHDITDRKVSERALVHSEERLRLILETAHDAFIGMDEHGVVTDWTHQAEKVFGWTRDEALGQNLADLIIPHSERTIHHKGLQRFLSTGEGPILNKRVEVLALHRSGKLFPVELTISPLKDGTSYTFHAFLHDISRRKQSEEELRHSQAFYESLVESLPLMVIRKDMAGKITFGNKLLARDLGLPLGQIIGKTDFDLFPQRLAEKYVRDDQQVIMAGRVSEAIEEHVDALGERLFVHVLKSPIRDVAGQIVGLQVLFWDVTEKHLAEEALDNLRRQHELILQSAGEGIVGVDSQGEIKFANPATARMLGREVDELIGRSFHEMFWPTFAEDPQSNPIAVSLRDGTQIHSEDDEFWRGNGSTFPVDFTSTAIRDEHGEIVGAVIVFEDISARKQTELELQQAVRELARSNEELQQFAYVASHDLQEPLRMVGSYLQLIERRYKDRLDSDANDFIHFAVDGATRMQSLINDLLAYSRVGTRTKSFGSVDLNEIVQQAKHHLEVTIREQGADVTATALPTVQGDMIQLLQLFQNLIGNAIKFHSAEPPRVQNNAEQVGLEWQIS